MKNPIYQKPELTVVSFRSERGYACSTCSGEPMSFGLSAILGSSSESSVGDDRSVISSNNWGSGW